MKRDKCISCKYYEPFFGSCVLHTEEIYVGDGDFDVMPVSIRSVNKSECEYEPKEKIGAYTISFDIINEMRRQ